jgi:hypothetical protein
MAHSGPREGFSSIPRCCTLALKSREAFEKIPPSFSRYRHRRPHAGGRGPFRQSIDYYFSGIGAPKYSNGFLEVPVKISLVNHSGESLAVDDLFITIYQFSEAG